MMKEILSQEQCIRTLKRMTHEIIEKNNDLNDVILCGILKKGYPIACAIADNLKKFSGISVKVFPIDITPFRDDVSKKISASHEKVNIENKTVILVDDVLYTGRSVRAAMDALIQHGRPKQIQLAIIIDRGHRELPIRADYIGKNIPTGKDEKIIIDVNDFTVFIESN